MSFHINHTLRKIIEPLRTAGGRFFIPPKLSGGVNQDSIIYKAATLVAFDKIEGDYLEFGVFTGGSFIHAYKAMKKTFDNATTHDEWNTIEDCNDRKALWNQARFFAFDSFKGLPKLEGIDTLSKDFTQEKYRSSLEQFNMNLQQASIPSHKIVAIPGWFEETLNKTTIKEYKIANAAIINIDCDLYQSTKVVLNFISPIMVDGSILIFDDWFSFKGNPLLGEQRAFYEWAERMTDWTFTQFQKEGAYRNSFIANRK
jgi:O-methyltransferase